MHDKDGKLLKVGDHVLLGGQMWEITSSGGSNAPFTCEIRELGKEMNAPALTNTNGLTKIRPWNELAQLALNVQDACNLSGVVHSFSQVITEVRARLEHEGKGGTDKINTHPVCILFSDKIASLTGTQTGDTIFMFKAYDWAKDIVEGKSV